MILRAAFIVNTMLLNQYVSVNGIRDHQLSDTWLRSSSPTMSIWWSMCSWNQKTWFTLPRAQLAKKIGGSGSNSTFIWQITRPAVHLSAFKELASLQFISAAFVQGLHCERMPTKFQVSAFFHFSSL